ncbi:fucolectin-like [Haliotis rubra]|uniref:fucolectin-like n=1 Tax=Haliotis rubra TaxID=36100 RepID=UPI001EE5A618|nr:fucolectin-like [Haliotis rubra]
MSIEYIPQMFWVQIGDLEVPDKMPTFILKYTGKINIALGKPASQSTTWRNFSASRANNGNRASHFSSGSCSHTEHETTNWWQVDLQGMYSIASVFIVNRDTQITGYYGYFLQDIEVHVFQEAPSSGLPNGTVCATHIPAMGANATLQCEAPVIGRYLRIYRRSSETVETPKLVFCEVEVYGRPVTTCGGMWG